MFIETCDQNHMFIKDYGKNKESFLLIIGDEYLRMSGIYGFYCDHVDEEKFSFKDFFTQSK